MESLSNSNILAKWAAGKITEEERQFLENEIDLKGLAAVLKDMDSWSLPGFNSTQKFEELIKAKNQQKERNKRTIRLRMLFPVAASIILLIGAFYIYFQNTSNIELKTLAGETIKQTLPAGSSVTLDARSVVRYSKWKWKKSREIELEGQAFFHVTPGSPFIVKTSEGNIEVLGTSFNIYTGKGLFKVQCYRGTVRVLSGKIFHILKEKEGVIIKDGIASEFAVEGQTPDWTKGFTKYESVTLYNVVEDLQKYYDVKIELPEKFSQLEYSGVVVHKDLETALEIVFKPMGISYTLTKENIVIFE